MPTIIETVEVAPQQFKNITKYIPEVESGKQAKVNALIDAADVTVDGYLFRTDEKWIDRMDRVVAAANARFIKLVVVDGETMSNAYATAYTNQTLPWKEKGGGKITVTVAQIVEAHRKGMVQFHAIWDANFD